MNNHEKLTKVIEYAIERGFELDSDIYIYQGLDAYIEYQSHFPINHSFIVLYDHDFAKAVFGEEDMYLVDTSPDWAHDKGDIEQEWFNKTKFDKHVRDILKSLPEVIRPEEGDGFKHAMMILPAWQAHIQQAVISEDPIEYYYNFIQNL